jgi:hypothetical protein
VVCHATDVDQAIICARVAFTPTHAAALARFASSPPERFLRVLELKRACSK